MSESDSVRISILEKNQDKLFERLDDISARSIRIEEGVKRMVQLDTKVSELDAKVIKISVLVSFAGTILGLFFNRIS